MTTLRSLLARAVARLRTDRPAPLDPAEAYRRWAATYGDEPNAFQRLEAPLFEACLGDLHGARVLDLGTGRGRLARRALAQGARSVVAADLVLAMLSAPWPSASGSTAPRRIVAPTHPLPFRQASFDLVTCALVLGHESDLTGAIRAMATVLRPGGQLIVSDFHPEATARGWQRTFLSQGKSHAIAQYLHTSDDYRAALGAAGLSIDRLEEATWQGHPVVMVLAAAKAG